MVPVQIPDMAVCVSLRAKDLEKGMNPSVLFYTLIK